VLSFLAGRSAALAHSATALHSSASTISNSAPIEYVGGFGGSLAGLAVNGTVAYIGEGASLTVLDITDAAHPTRLARLALTDLPSDLALAGGRLYVADRSAGLLIYDVSDPTSPLRLGVFSTPLRVSRVRILGTLAYVVAGDMLVVDVQDPTAPRQLGSYHAPSPINNLVVSSNRAYLAYGYAMGVANGGVIVVDVANPALPAALGNIDLSSEAALDVQVDANLIYIITAVDTRSFQRPRLIIADMSNITNLTIRGSYDFPGYPSLMSRASLLIANGLAYAAGYPGGLLTLDVHTPEAIMFINQSTTLGGSAGLQLIGGRLYAVTDGISYSYPGFQIISLDTRTSPAQIGGYDTMPTIAGVDVANGIANVAHYSRGFQLVDVHDPTQPILRGAYPMVEGPSQVQIVGNLAYIIGGNTGLHIMDVSNPDNPLRLGGLPPNGSTRAIRIIGNLAYITGINQLAIVNVSDAAQPMQLAAYHYYTGDDSGVDVAGNRAYFATGNNGLVILDVSNPTTPLQRSVQKELARYSDVQVVANRAYVAAWTDGLAILDLTNPDSPMLLSKIHTVQNAYYVRVIAGFAYVSEDPGAVEIFDVRDPANPTQVAQFSTIDSAGKVQVVGDLMYVPSRTAGLHIVRLHFDRFPVSATLGAAGGAITTADGGINLNIPSGALTATATLTLTPSLDPALIPDSGRGVLRSVKLEIRDSHEQLIDHLDQPYTLTISYTDEQLAAQKFNEASLHVLYWNGSAWVILPACETCGVDTVLNRVTLTTDQAGAFALVGAAGPTITSAMPPATAIAHHRYHHIFTASGSPAPTFHVALGALPPGLSLDSITGVLDGVPSVPGSYTFAIAARNGVAPDSQQFVTLTVRAAIYLPLIGDGP
jgi:hypothetical protein